MPKLEFDRVDYPHFKELADSIKRAAEEGRKRLPEYQRVALVAAALHLAGAAILWNGIRTLNTVRIARSSYLNLAGALVQGFGHARLRRAKEAVEKGRGELKKAFKSKVEESPSEGRDEQIPAIAKQVFEEFGVWGAVSLKFVKKEKPTCDLNRLARRCQAARAEQKWLRRAGRITLAVGAVFPVLFGLSLYMRRGVALTFPLAIGGVAASLSVAAYWAGVRSWGKLEEKSLEEAVWRAIICCKGEGVDWDTVGPFVRKIRGVSGEAWRGKCPRLKVLKLPNATTVGTLPKKVEHLSLRRFPVGEVGHLQRLTILEVETVNDQELGVIGKLCYLTRLKIKRTELSSVDKLCTLPSRLERLEAPTIGHFEGTNPLAKHCSLKRVNLHHFGVGTAKALEGLSILEVLKVETGEGMSSGDLGWISDHPHLQKVVVKAFHKGRLTVNELEALHTHFLFFVSGVEKDLKKEGVGAALRPRDKQVVTLKIRH